MRWRRNSQSFGKQVGRGNVRNEDCDERYRCMDETVENGDNCQKDKTELIHFSPAAKQQQQLYSIPLGSNSIQFTSATKVLGVCIDNKLSFEDHSCKMAKKMCNRWRTITRLTSRTNGLNHQVIVKPITTTFLPILLFGGIVWMTTKNIRSINGIWYEMLKRSIRAIYNVNQSIAEVITGQPPLSIWNKMNSIKHYLKTFQQSGVFRKRRVHGLHNQKIEWLPRINNRKRFERRGSLPGVEKNRTPGVFYWNRTQSNGGAKT